MARTKTDEYFIQHGEQFLLGYVPERNCSNYSPDDPTPTWDSLLNLLAKENINDMLIMFLGKTGSPPMGCGSTGHNKVPRKQVQGIPIRHWDVNQGSLVSLTRDSANTAPWAQELLQLDNPPQHIVGIVVRKLS